MAVGKHAAWQMAMVLAVVAALATGTTDAAFASTPPDSVKVVAPTPNAKVKGTVTLRAQTTGKFATVAFSVAKWATKNTLVLLPVGAPSAQGTWDVPWDTSTLPNGKYAITTYARRADHSYIQAPAFAITLQNPVVAVRPASVASGRSVTVHLQFAPPHVTATATAAVRQCIGAAPVTAQTWATRCDPTTETLSRPYGGLTVLVTTPARLVIHDPATGTANDCSAGDCSVAISTNGLVMSGPVLVKAP
jgi:hypothetical protein